MQDLYKKKLTDAGTKRKAVVSGKLFKNRRYTILMISLYISVIPILKSYVMLYERKEPLVHTLHEEHSKLLEQFLACFIKPEILINKSVKELLELDVTKNNMKTADMFIGSTPRGIINETKSPKSDPFVMDS